MTKSEKRASKKESHSSKAESPKLSNQKVPKSKKIIRGLGLTIWAGVALFVTELVVSFISLKILGLSLLQQPVVQMIVNAIIYILAFIVIAVLPLKLFSSLKTTREELGLQGLPTWTDIGLAPIGLIVYFLLAGLLVALFSMFDWFEVNEAQNVGFNILGNGTDYLLAFFALCVIAPIAEEAIFRGWLYGKLRAELNLPISILLTSALFGFMHFQWNVGVNVFGMSIVMCFLREITGTIYSGIFLHMIKNGIAFYLLYLARYM